MPRAARRPAAWEPSDTGCARCGRHEIANSGKPHKPLTVATNHVYCHSCRMQMRQRLLLMVERQTAVEARLRRVYRLTLAEYGVMFDRQRGVCAICRDRESAIMPYDVATGLVVDHDHDSGEVRGLLCSRCNSGIGLLGDEPRNLDAAAEYLRERKARPAAS